VTTKPVALGPERLRTIARRLDAGPSIARRSAGPFGTFAAYLPGERIEGVRVVADNHLEIHVVMRWAATVDDVERDVIAAVDDQTVAVDVIVDDIDLATQKTRKR